MENENDVDFIAAKNEQEILARELLAEILPLLKDYFVGEIIRNEDEIIYKMLNGQEFLISAWERDKI